MKDDPNDRRSGKQRITSVQGGRIRFERQIKGWTQADLAAASGLSVEYVARLERGEEKATTADATSIAGALGVSVGALAHAAPDETRMTKRGVG